MTYNPDTLRDAGRYWVEHGGVNLGVVGDAGHVGRGVSYHLGEDQLEPNAYSRVTVRDHKGLTNAASAIDLGKLGGQYAKLRAFSDWLVSYARANGEGTADLREIIYSPNGITVLRWDRERGYSSAPRAGEADNTHLTHTHISWYRDAETRDHTVIFRAYFESEAHVKTAKLIYYDVANVKPGKPVRGENGTPVIHTTPTPGPTSYPLLVTGESRYLIRLPGDVAGWIAKTDVGSISQPGPIPPLPPAPDPDGVYNTALEDSKAAIDTLKR